MQLSAPKILDRLREIRRRIEAAASRAGRDPRDVSLVAVTKKAAPEDVRTLLESGEIRFLGENRLQDAQRRREALGSQAGLASWRFIGHLQTNKAKEAAETFDWIDSVDSLKLAGALDAHLSKSGRRKNVLIQVKLSDRETQSGVAPEELGEFLDRLKDLKSLDPRGLMLIAPMVEPVSAVRPFFRKMKDLLDRSFSGRAGEPPVLSMGMSRDFEIAVEEGAHLVRIGSALFSAP